MLSSEQRAQNKLAFALFHTSLLSTFVFSINIESAEAAPDPGQDSQSPGVFESDGCITPEYPHRLWGTTQDLEA